MNVFPGQTNVESLEPSINGYGYWLLCRFKNVLHRKTQELEDAADLVWCAATCPQQSQDGVQSPPLITLKQHASCRDTTSNLWEFFVRWFDLCPELTMLCELKSVDHLQIVPALLWYSHHSCVFVFVGGAHWRRFLCSLESYATFLSNPRRYHVK